MSRGKSNIFIIAAPTGGGETTITREIIKKYPRYVRLVTATTRRPRANDKNEVDYYFFSKERFLHEIEKGNISEYTYVKNRDTYYGTYKPDLEKKLKQGFIVIVNPDLVGAKYYKKNYNATTVFIKPDSIESLKKRLKNREPDISDEELNKRLENAQAEIRNEEKYYDYSIVNEEGKIKETVEKVVAILKKEGYELDQKNPKHGLSE